MILHPHATHTHTHTHTHTQRDNVVDLSFTTLLTSQVIIVAFCSERGKSDKFCSGALISAWGSFTCRKSMTRDPRLYFPSEGSHTQDFYALKKCIDPGRVWTREPHTHMRIRKHTAYRRKHKKLILIYLIFGRGKRGWHNKPHFRCVCAYPFKKKKKKISVSSQKLTSTSHDLVSSNTENSSINILVLWIRGRRVIGISGSLI